MTLLSSDCASPAASAASCCVSSPRCPATAHANVSSRRFLQCSRTSAGRSSYCSDAAKPASTSVTLPDIQFSFAWRCSRRSRLPRSIRMHRNGNPKPQATATSRRQGQGLSRPRVLLRGHAAVQREDCAGGKAAFVAGEKQDAGRDLLGGAETAEELARRQRLLRALARALRG